jgi:hypothetical protein
MNSDQEYLYIDVTFNAACTEVTMKLGVFMFTEKLGLKGGSLEGEEALQFLKSTVHGKQPDLINYFWLFNPDAKVIDFGMSLTVIIPPIQDVKFKHNKFDRKRRAFKTSMMSIPCVQIPKNPKTDVTESDIKTALERFRNLKTTPSGTDAVVYEDMKDIEAQIIALTAKNLDITPALQIKMNDAYESYSKIKFP